MRKSKGQIAREHKSAARRGRKAYREAQKKRIAAVAAGIEPPSNEVADLKRQGFVEVEPGRFIQFES